jgi:hypothetical protein
MDTTEHNGYPNRATWLVQLHMTNDEAWYRLVRDEVNARTRSSIEWWWATSDEQWTDLLTHASATIARFLEDLVREAMLTARDQAPAPASWAMLTDLLGNVLREVDWTHLAELWVDDEVDWTELVEQLPDELADEVHREWQRIDYDPATDPYIPRTELERIVL